MGKLKKIPQDCRFPQLQTVLDPERFREHLQRRLAPEFARGTLRLECLKLKKVYYKPEKSCRLMFEVDILANGDRPIRQLYFGRVLPPEKLDKVWRRAQDTPHAQPPAGPAMQRLDDLGLVLWAYPNDPNLPGLAVLAQADAVRSRLAASPQAFGIPAGAEITELRHGVAKYVPGQRCGYRFRVLWCREDREGEATFYAKAYQPGEGARAHAIMEQILASEACRSGRLRVPRTLAFDADTEILWQEMVPGRSFSKEIGALELRAWAPRIARSLAAFHASVLDLDEGLGLEQELEELRASSRKICEAYPQHAGHCRTLTERLLAAAARLPEVPRAPVHGSFKVSHVFDVGGDVAFIDFDGAGLGDPTYDVGRLFAHLAIAGLNSKTDADTVEAALGDFKAVYAAGVPWPWPEARVRWYTSALLVSSQAYKCVKRMAPERVAAILECAARWFPETEHRAGGGEVPGPEAAEGGRQHDRTP